MAHSFIEFLSRYPWSQYEWLNGIFSNQILALFVADVNQKNKVRKIHIPKEGVFWALINEPNKTIPQIYRLRLVRDFALKVMGHEGLLGGLSPTDFSDLCVFWPATNKIWHLWGDLGGCAPESLKFIYEPRRIRIDEGKLIITADHRRVDLIANLLSKNWVGKGEVFIHHAFSNVHKKVELGIIPGRRQSPHTQPKLPGVETTDFIEKRLSGERGLSVLGTLAISFSSQHYELLTFVGNNPLLTKHELSCVFQNGKRYNENVKIVGDLIDKKLVVEAPPGWFRDRYILSNKGIKIIAGYWGVNEDRMLKSLPWPIKKASGKFVYSIGWANQNRHHTNLLREFSLSVLEGARRVSKPQAGITAELVTTIGARLLYHKIRGANATNEWIIPDGQLSVDVWKKGWLEGRVTNISRSLFNKQVLVEIDRATYSRSYLEKRLDKYREAWDLLSGKTVLVWVSTGPPHREKQLIDMMSIHGIEGWTVLHERLILPKKDPWWNVHPSNGVEVGYSSLGGLSPWRSVWRYSMNKTYQMLPFLGYEPWLE